MIYRLVTIIMIAGILAMLILIYLEQYKGIAEPALKPILWTTILALLLRVFIRAKKNRD